MVFKATVGGAPVELSATAPLPDGRELVQGPLTYNGDGLATAHNLGFMSDPRFLEASALGMRQIEIHAPETYARMWDLRYRIYDFCWAADHARHLKGDFVDCGVWVAAFSASAAKYISFEQYTDKTWYMLDTYESYPLEQFNPEELAMGIDKDTPHFATTNLHAIVGETFSPYPNIKLVKGPIPDTLTQVPSTEIAYLSVDLNAAKPSVDALEYFWPKLVKAGVVVLDDYGFQRYAAQKKALDTWARANDVPIYASPTGHGIIIKP